MTLWEDDSYCCLAGYVSLKSEKPCLAMESFAQLFRYYGELNHGEWK